MKTAFRTPRTRITSWGPTCPPRSFAPAAITAKKKAEAIISRTEAHYRSTWSSERRTAVPGAEARASPGRRRSRTKRVARPRGRGTARRRVPYFRPFGAPRPRPHHPDVVLLLHGGRASQAGPRADGCARRALRARPPRLRGVPPASGGSCRFPREAWPKVLAMGLLSVPVYNVFFFHGMKTVPSGTGALIIALNPVFTAVLARVVLGEPFGRRQVAGLVLALAGALRRHPLRYREGRRLALPLERPPPRPRPALLGDLHGDRADASRGGRPGRHVVRAPLRREPAAPRLRAAVDGADPRFEPGGPLGGPLPRDSVHAPGAGSRSSGL